jgi:replicative superfamily II helicase
VRIVGLSATLPNYKDVAKFLRVNATSGTMMMIVMVTVMMMIIARMMMMMMMMTTVS